MRLFILVAAVSMFSGLGCQAQSIESPNEQNLEALDNANTTISSGRQTAITRAVEVAAPAVVSINVISVERVQVRDPFFSDPFFEQFFGRRSREYERLVQGLGSGFVISADGYIVTNHHVIDNANEITVSFRDGSTLPAVVIGTDEATDLALLKVDSDEELRFIPFARSSAIVGEWAIALGNPFGLFDATEPTVTVGVVSARDRDFEVKDRHVYRDMIQTDASINQGNSGGPLVNAIGEVIGVNTFIFTQSGGSIGLGFAVPAAKASRIVDEIRTQGKVDRSYYTGLYGVDVDAAVARELRLEQPAGVLIEKVDPDSPAEIAGFKPWDVIVGVEGEFVANRGEFVARLYDFRPGDTVAFEAVRLGRPVVLQMQLGRYE
ncbi:MAG: trypsin-like serine protease [Rhodothermales bacterium]|nr:trypsin-like serine protease [Rhodothermales bacterium]